MSKITHNAVNDLDNTNQNLNAEDNKQDGNTHDEKNADNHSECAQQLIDRFRQLVDLKHPPSEYGDPGPLFLEPNDLYEAIITYNKLKSIGLNDCDNIELSWLYCIFAQRIERVYGPLGMKQSKKGFI